MREEMIAQRIVDAIDSERVILLGSVAEGCVTDDSDIDLFVVWDAHGSTVPLPDCTTHGLL